MKTVTETKFDRIIKEGFHEALKPLGFKKKANNFYLQLDGLGQIINIQKSRYGTKQDVGFTINTGIFVPEYWLESFNYNSKGLPGYPTEPECLIRQRIGQLRNETDIWYDVNEQTDVDKLVSQMNAEIENYILPYFRRLGTVDKMLQELESTEMPFISLLGKLITFGELKQFDKAKREYEKLLTQKIMPSVLESVKEYGEKYGLI